MNRLTEIAFFTAVLVGSLTLLKLVKWMNLF